MFASSRGERINKRKICIVVLVMMLLVGMYKRNAYCYGTREANIVTYRNIARAMNEQNVAWTLAYGSLLGAIRENNLLLHEYDIDIAVDSCKNLDKLRDEFPKYGLTYFNQSDYIAPKRKITYDTTEKQIKVASAYLHAPCGRLYANDGSGNFADIYNFSKINPDEFSKYPDLLMPKFPDPESPNEQRALACCNHGTIKEEWEAGGCQHANNWYPFQKGTFLGMPAYYPNKPERVLEEHYGLDWRIPVTKGLRKVLC